jgi:hypothetical protein
MDIKKILMSEITGNELPEMDLIEDYLIRMPEKNKVREDA